MALPSLTVRPSRPNTDQEMDTTARLNARRFLAPRPLAPRPLAPKNEDSVRSNELLTRLVETLTRTFAFSPREQQVLDGVLFGHTAAAIAWRLGIRETSVHKHMHRIFAKTKTDSRKRLLDLALRLAANDAFVTAPRPAAVRN